MLSCKWARQTPLVMNEAGLVSVEATVRQPGLVRAGAGCLLHASNSRHRHTRGS
jgi:hypothetical protein